MCDRILSYIPTNFYITSNYVQIHIIESNDLSLQ